MELVTIISFTYPHEASLVKSLLEDNEIYVNLKDEHASQVYHMASNAFGGIKLQVRDDDYKNAREILENQGYIPDDSDGTSTLFTSINRFTSRIPFLNNKHPEQRFIGFMFMVVAVLLAPIMYLLFKYFI